MPVETPSLVLPDHNMFYVGFVESARKLLTRFLLVLGACHRPVLDTTARVFTERFYGALFVGKQLGMTAEVEGRFRA